MRTLKTSFTILVVSMLMASCNQSILEDNYTAPQVFSERIDMAFEGAVEAMFNREDEAGLFSTYANSTPIANEDELVMRIDLDGENSLDLIFYNAHLNDPLSSTLYYHSYPMAELDDKTAYVVINYTSGEGEAEYSTSPNGNPAHIQPNVFEIRGVDADGLDARIRDLTLYQVDNTQGGTSAETTIRINGTFKAKN